MWRSHIESINGGSVQKFAILRDGTPVAFSSVLEHWCSDAGFRSYFTALLADSPFGAYRWETRPLTSSNADRAFEFVLLNSAGLDRPVDRNAFSRHFTNDNDVVTFPNLGGDAVMVVPCPIVADTIYGHLASFIRNAPDAQVHRLWQSVGDAMKARLGERPVWLSTAGMGVSWLHVRLDSRPKYYGHAPYKHVA